MNTIICILRPEIQVKVRMELGDAVAKGNVKELRSALQKSHWGGLPESELSAVECRLSALEKEEERWKNEGHVAQALFDNALGFEDSTAVTARA